MKTTFVIAVLIATALGIFYVRAETTKAAPYITVASTTSTQSSGLYDYLLPQFTAYSGIEVRVIAVGTGQAIRLAERGDADVLLVHHRTSENQFVAQGYARKRYDLMHNDFVFVGPDDLALPEAERGDSAKALRWLQAHQKMFVSRGDDSGTHKKELELWAHAGFDVSQLDATSYQQVGQGMGGTLNTAIGLNAVTMTDRATWAKRTYTQGYRIWVEGDAMLKNPYSVLLVSQQKHPHVKAKAGQAFIDWLLSTKGQAAIAAYRIKGMPVFYVD